MDWPLDIDDLLKFSLEVAQGLDFLAAKNVSDCVEIFSEENILGINLRAAVCGSYLQTCQ